MCEFISWIPTIVDGKEVPLFLTDKELPKLPSHHDNDPLGHSAIRAFYGLTQPTLDLRSGGEREDQNFWVLEQYPEEIRSLLTDEKTIRKTWGKMIGAHFGSSEVEYVLRYAATWAKAMVLDLVGRRTTNSKTAHVALKNTDTTFRWRKRLIGMIVEAKNGSQAHDTLCYVPSLTEDERAPLIGVIVETKAAESARDTLCYVPSLTEDERAPLIGVIVETKNPRWAEDTLRYTPSLTENERAPLIGVIVETKKRSRAHDTLRHTPSLTEGERASLIGVIVAEKDAGWAYSTLRYIPSLTEGERAPLIGVIVAAKDAGWAKDTLHEVPSLTEGERTRLEAVTKSAT